jgi:hypothetical protein
MKILVLTTLIAIITLANGCVQRHISITKTSSGFFEPTDANFVKILQTQPSREFIELGAVLTSGWKMQESNSMYNGIRTKAGQIGADAVYIQSQGVAMQGDITYRWAEGVAIKYKEPN